MLHLSSLKRHHVSKQNQLHNTAHHITQTARAIELVQHTQPRAAGQSVGGAVQDPGHLVERSEPGVQLIHPNRNTAVWEMDLKLDKSINSSVGTS